MCGYGQKVIWGLFRKRAQLQLLIEIKINARVAFDPGLYGKRTSKSDLYHLKPLLILHKGGS